MDLEGVAAKEFYSFCENDDFEGIDGFILKHKELDSTNLEFSNTYTTGTGRQRVIHKTLLHAAVVSGKLSIVKHVMEHYTHDINAIDSDFNTPLYVAVSLDYKDIVEFLINKGAKINVMCIYEMTALTKACKKGNLEIIKILCENGADVNYTRELIYNNAYKSAKNRFYRPIMDVIRYNPDRIDIIEYLLLKGASLGSVSPDKTRPFTPMHLASCYGHKEAFDVMFSYGGNCVLYKTHYKGLLYVTLLNKQYDMAKYLIKLNIITKRDLNFSLENVRGIDTDFKHYAQSIMNTLK